MKQNLLKIILVFASLGLMLISVTLGMAKGKKIAQSRLVVQNFKALNSALQYAYSDMDRFPQATEFSNADLMKNYITPFPLPEFVSGTCPQNWVYRRISQSSYELNFCLPQADEEYSAGWNKFSGTPLQE